MKRKFGVVHGLASCQDCGWETSSYKNCQEIAAIHARKNRHRVQVEIGIAGWYDGKAQG